MSCLDVQLLQWAFVVQVAVGEVAAECDVVVLVEYVVVAAAITVTVAVVVAVVVLCDLLR